MRMASHGMQWNRDLATDRLSAKHDGRKAKAVPTRNGNAMGRQKPKRGRSATVALVAAA